MVFDANKIAGETDEKVQAIIKQIGHELIDKCREISERPEVKEITALADCSDSEMGLRMILSATASILASYPGATQPHKTRLIMLFLHQAGYEGIQIG